MRSFARSNPVRRADPGNRSRASLARPERERRCGVAARGTQRYEWPAVAAREDRRETVDEADVEEFAIRPLSRPASLTLAAAALLLGAPAPAQTTWVVNEVFSTADETVQFIELTSDADGQDGVNDAPIELFSMDALLASAALVGDLPSSQTARHFLLLGTMNLPGGVLPDYVFPDEFRIDVGRTDEIQFNGGLPFFIDQGTIPTDGVSSLNRQGGTLLASPTRFGLAFPQPMRFLPEPSLVLSRTAALAAAALLSLRRRARAGRRRAPLPTAAESG